MDTKTLTLKFFAGIREAMGEAVRRETFGADVGTAGDVVRHLEERFPAFREAAPRLLLAVNLRYANPVTPVADGDEIAFFPPVGGG
jgi:molybdopterin synthase sulfur carrier subunit